LITALSFVLGALAVAGGVALGAYITWRLMQRESPLPAPARPKPFECFGHTDEDEALLEEQR
jgi:hypothetical protein